jgi:hypothetical protein
MPPAAGLRLQGRGAGLPLGALPEHPRPRSQPGLGQRGLTLCPHGWGGRGRNSPLPAGPTSGQGRRPRETKTPCHRWRRLKPAVAQTSALLGSRDETGRVGPRDCPRGGVIPPLTVTRRPPQKKGGQKFWPPASPIVGGSAWESNPCATYSLLLIFSNLPFIPALPRTGCGRFQTPFRVSVKRWA